MFFFVHLTQSRHSHLKTTTQWEGERCNFLSKLGFHTQYCVNISVLLSEERDYAAVFMSIITVNITVPGSRHCPHFICHDDLPMQPHRDVREAFQEQSSGWHVNEAGLCEEREQRYRLMLPASHWNWSFCFKHFRK